jgi:hypothetical protein
MGKKRHIFKRAAITGAVIACGLIAPGSASAAGIDQTGQCIFVATYSWNPYVAGGTTKYIDQLKGCNYAFISLLMDTQKRVEWQKCVTYGITRSVPPLGWEPAIYAAESCTEDWLGVHHQVDPPVVR